MTQENALYLQEKKPLGIKTNEIITKFKNGVNAKTKNSPQMTHTLDSHLECLMRQQQKARPKVGIIKGITYRIIISA